MKIRTRLLVFNLTLLILTVSVLGVTFFIFGEKYLQHLAIKDVERASHQTLLTVDRFFKSRIAEQRTLSRSTFFFRKLDYDQIQSRFEDYRQYYHTYQSISFYDIQRIRRIDLNRLNLGLKSEMSDLFDRATKAEGPVFQFDVSSGTRPVVHFLTKVQASGEPLRGFVLATVPLANLKRSLVGLSDPQKGPLPSEVQLFSRDGSRIYSRLASTSLALKNEASTDFNLERGGAVLRSEQLENSGTLYESADAYTIFYEKTNLAEPANSWKLAYRVNKHELEKPIVVMRKLILAIFAVLVLVAVALNSWLSQSLLLPIETLTSSMLTYNLTEVSVDQKELRRPDEIGVLTRGVHDLTERLKTNFAELSTTSKFVALGEMAAGIAHEINNPLTVIMGRAAMLDRMGDTVEGKNVRESSQKIIEMVHRITRTIHALRVYARSGESDPVGVESVESIIESTLDISLERMRLASIDVKVTIDPADAVIIARPVQVSQILMNLLNNAHDAIVASNAEERWIQVCVSETATCVRICVQNSGPRISKHVELRLFEPFFTTKPSGVGTGLGLTISQRLAAANGATLRLESSASLTTFLIEFPRPDLTLLHDNDAAPEANPKNGAGKGV